VTTTARHARAGPGDYAEAERRYQQSLTIFDELGNRAGATATISQLGNLRAETGNPAEAVAVHSQALAIRLPLGVPQVINNINRLIERHSILDKSAFPNAASTVPGKQIKCET
jgi:Tetratricopeptide repeat